MRLRTFAAERRHPPNQEGAVQEVAVTQHRLVVEGEGSPDLRGIERLTVRRGQHRQEPHRLLRPRRQAPLGQVAAHQGIEVVRLPVREHPGLEYAAVGVPPAQPEVVETPRRQLGENEGRQPDQTPAGPPATRRRWSSASATPTRAAGTGRFASGRRRWCRAGAQTRPAPVAPRRSRPASARAPGRPTRHRAGPRCPPPPCRNRRPPGASPGWSCLTGADRRWPRRATVAGLRGRVACRCAVACLHYGN